MFLEVPAITLPSLRTFDGEFEMVTFLPAYGSMLRHTLMMSLKAF